MTKNRITSLTTLFLLVLISQSALCQTVISGPVNSETTISGTVISGTVKGEKGELIPSASISLNVPGLKTTSDSAGNFRLEISVFANSGSHIGIPAKSGLDTSNPTNSRLEKANHLNSGLGTTVRGKHILSVTSVGYKSFRKEINIQDSNVQVDIVLHSDSRILNEVTVSAGSFEANDKAKGASLTPMDAVTVAGSNADITQALRSLPGSQQIGEKEGLFVRGGTGDETKQFIDGTLLKNPNFPSVPGITQYARLDLFLFKGILFNSGGYSALYGQAMSSALILESIDIPEQSSASFNIFPANIGTGIQQVARDKRSSCGISFAYSNQSIYNSVVPQKPDYFHGPEYLVNKANFRIKTGKTGILKFYTNSSISNVGMRNPDIDSSSLRSGYQVKGKDIYANLSFRSYLASDWKLDMGLAYSYNRYNTIRQLLDDSGKVINLPAEPFDHKNGYSLINTHFAQGRVLFTKLFSHNQAMRFGAEHFYSKDKGMINDTAIRLSDNLLAAFAETDIYLAKGLAAKIGVRTEYSSLLNRIVAAPRLSLAYGLTNGGQFNLAYGIFYQEPLNEFLYYATQLNFSRATHYILNYTRKVNNRFFRVEAYYKRYNKLVKTEPDINNNGKGYARGLELFFRDKKSIRNLDYWITYTWLDTKRDFMNFPKELRPSFSAPHTATVAIKKFLPDISTSLNVSYAVAAGRPYYDIRYNSSGDALQIYDNGTTKAYSVLNLHVAWLTSFFKGWRRKDFSGIAFGVNNLLGTKQVFGYNYSYDGSNKLPVGLPANRNYFIGIFMSFGIDRTDDFIDNNL